MKLSANQLRKLILSEMSAVAGKDPNRFLHGFDSGHPNDDEGYMIMVRMNALQEMAEEICDTLDSQDQLPGWVQDHVAVAHENLRQVHSYLMGDEAIRNKSKSATFEGRIASRKQNLSEAHTRITAKEIQEWKNGDWGYVQGDDPENEDL